MQHLGDITQISGYTVPIVDCVIGGSPCQGLSVAGLGKGLDDARSGLFIEQVRITKEMRDRDKANGRSGVDVRPRHLVWENVVGAVSSNKGEDFRVVLEELARIGEPGVTIPRPPSGKWKTSGVIIGDGYSIAWRVMDAQNYGVPQIRRRIVLVADFGGHNAPCIVFGDGQHLRGSVGVDPEQAIRHSGSGRGQEVSSVGDRLRGNTPSCAETRKRTAPDAQGGVGADDREGAVGADPYNGCLTCSTSSTLGVNCGLATGRSAVVSFEPGIASREGGHIYECVSGTLLANAGDNQMATVYAVENHPADSRVNIDESGTVQTLTSRMGTGGGNAPMVMEPFCKTSSPPRYIVRRLTTTECERLQGYPDGWTDIGDWVDSKGKKHKAADSPRYKALGNSIALPVWKIILKRLCACYERDATMASLFDGIGGFPYLWEQINGEGSCLWASEIEEFPMAVTRKRINKEY